MEKKRSLTSRRGRNTFIVMIQTSHPERGKLTKKFFMSLPDSTFLVSRARNGANEPMFAKAVVHRAERDEQWRRVRSANASGRLCSVFDSRQHFEEFYRAFPTYAKYRSLRPLKYGPLQGTTCERKEKLFLPSTSQLRMNNAGASASERRTLVGPYHLTRV
jgi:hypothetical protein